MHHQYRCVFGAPKSGPVETSSGGCGLAIYHSQPHPQGPAQLCLWTIAGVDPKDEASQMRLLSDEWLAIIILLM